MLFILFYSLTIVIVLYWYVLEDKWRDLWTTLIGKLTLSCFLLTLPDHSVPVMWLSIYSFKETLFTLIRNQLSLLWVCKNDFNSKCLLPLSRLGLNTYVYLSTNKNTNTSIYLYLYFFFNRADENYLYLYLKCPGPSWKCPGPSRKCPGHSRKCPGPSLKCPGPSGKCPGHSMKCPGHSQKCPCPSRKCPSPSRKCPGPPPQEVSWPLPEVSINIHSFGHNSGRLWYTSLNCLFSST